MWTLILRRLTGIAIVLTAIAYAVAKWKEYDIPDFDAPNWVHSPAFWSGMAVVGIWAWFPVLLPVGSREVSLAQEVPRRYSQPGTIENEPFEMPPGSGQWFIIWHGQYMYWETATNQWEPYKG